MPVFSRIGVVQNAPHTADLSNNLRQLVQGYRDCLNHGAQLVIAAGDALCGHELQSLARRRSFIMQTQAALKALANEIGQVPLILGAYTFVFDDEQYDPKGEPKIRDEFDLLCNEDSDRENITPTIAPFMLQNGLVFELLEGEVNNVLGMHIYVDCDDMEILPDAEKLDLIVRLPVSAWYAGEEGDDERTRSWEADKSGVPVIQINSVGSADGRLFAGGSSAYNSRGKLMARLPYFEAANKVVDLQNDKPAKFMKEDNSRNLLCSSLVCGIRDTVRNNGFSGVCINLDQKNAPVLTALSILAMGADNVWGVTFSGKNALADSMGVTCRQIRIDSVAAEASACLGGFDNKDLRSRLASSIMVTLAEQRGLMPLSSLSRDEIMLGEFTLYGESCGHIAPLGNLYEEEICMLNKFLKDDFPSLSSEPDEPENPELNMIIHDIADKNLPVSALLEGLGAVDYEENDIRMVQRRILASALKRQQMPISLHIEPSEEQQQFPISHRLDD